MKSIWNIHIGTIFPDLFPGTLAASCVGRCRGTDWELFVYDLREYATKGRIDRPPFGGGGGMIIKCDVIHEWIMKSNLQSLRKIYLSPRGQVFKHELVDDLTAQDLLLLCGRYEGIDQRVLDHWNFEELSLGDFVLHGGEVAAMAIVESCLRKFAVKNYTDTESFSGGPLLEHHQYTKPRIWAPSGTVELYPIPEVLFSGHHAKVEDWKIANSMAITSEKRPDLLAKYQKMNKTKVISNKKESEK